MGIIEIMTHLKKILRVWILKPPNFKTYLSYNPIKIFYSTTTRYGFLEFVKYEWNNMINENAMNKSSPVHGMSGLFWARLQGLSYVSSFNPIQLMGLN